MKVVLSGSKIMINDLMAMLKAGVMASKETILLDNGQRNKP